MFAVCAPKLIRLVSVRWRRGSGSNTCGNGIGRASMRRWPSAPPLIVVAGPTATGKTELGIRLGEWLIAAGRPAVVISADSRQVYRGLDIGTAKVSAADRARVPHAGLDLVDPDERFALSDFVEHATGVLEDDRGTGRRRAAGRRDGPLSPGRRARPRPRFAPGRSRRPRHGSRRSSPTDGLAPLAERDCGQIAPTLAAETDLANPRRVIRALEIAELRGDGPRPRPRGYDGPSTWIGLDCRRDEHRRWIAAARPRAVR